MARLMVCKLSCEGSSLFVQVNVFSSVVRPLATVKPLTRSPRQPSGCRQGMFLCRLWRILLNIKFDEEDEPLFFDKGGLFGKDIGEVEDETEMSVNAL